jgi:hypothetical protein
MSADATEDRRPGESLLDYRVRIFKIPPLPSGVAMFERVLVYRIPDAASASETWGDGPILKDDMRLTTDKATSPRGIVVSAGLAALDVMRANGMELGDIVWIAPNVFYRFMVGSRKGKPIEFPFLNVGDIITDEDLADRLFHHEDGDEPEMVIAYDPHQKQHTITRNGRYLGPRSDPRHYPDEP